MSDIRDFKAIAGQFAEALGNLEDALCWLERVNEQYDPEQHADDIRLVTEYGLRPCNPAMDFWLQAELAEDVVKGILDRLQRVEPLVPKETEAHNTGGSSEPLRQLIDAIGRHPAAERDPDVADAVNAVEDALRQKETG